MKGLDSTMASLRDFARTTSGETLAELIKFARLACVNLAHATQPFGLSSASQLTGSKMVGKDIGSLFATPESLFAGLTRSAPDAANQFWWAYKSKKSTEMSTALADAGRAMEIAALPSRPLLRANRGRGGHVKTAQPKQLVTGPRALSSFLAEKQRNVGFAKGGWAAAARDLGGSRGIPAWAGSKQKAPGSATLSPDLAKPTVLISNNVRYIRDALPEAQQAAALAVTVEKLVRQLQIIARKPRRTA